MEFDLQNLIASVGFPITLSMYLLVRIEGKLQTLSDSINELSKNIISMKWNKIGMAMSKILCHTYFILYQHLIYFY